MKVLGVTGRPCFKKEKSHKALELQSVGSGQLCPTAVWGVHEEGAFEGASAWAAEGFWQLFLGGLFGRNAGVFDFLPAGLLKQNPSLGDFWSRCNMVLARAI